MKLTGKQRLRQVEVKMRIKADRELRDFREGRIGGCGSFRWKEREAIAAEFDRAYALGFEAGRRALSPDTGGEGV